MRKVGDKIFYDINEEIIDPSNTALVVWDVQICRSIEFLTEKNSLTISIQL
jgi:hypothetical protein